MKDLLKYSNKESHELTIEAIEEALLSLMRENDFSSISIQQISNRAGVSRTAFYKNYNSKEEVVESILLGIASKIMKEIGTGKDGSISVSDNKDLFTKVFKKIKEYSNVYITISKSGLNYIIQDTAKQFAESFIDSSGLNLKYAASYYSGGVSSVMTEYIRRGMAESPKEMGEIVNNLVK